MALRARKVSGAFKKQVPDPKIPALGRGNNIRRENWIPYLKTGYVRKSVFDEFKMFSNISLFYHSCCQVVSMKMNNKGGSVFKVAFI